MIQPQTIDNKTPVDVFEHYRDWRELYVAYSTLKKGQKTNANKERLRVVRKQIIRQYFKNFFLFPIWLFRFLKPSYLKGPVTVWTNLRTIFRSSEFRPLRLAVVSQVVFCFVFIRLGMLIFYNLSVPTDAATYGWIQTDWSGGVSTTAYATHASNQTGWTYFYATSSTINTSTAGQISLTIDVNTSTETTDTDFNAWSKSNVYTSSTGSGGKLVLLKPNGASCTSLNECSSTLCEGNLCTEPPCTGSNWSMTYGGETYPFVLIGEQCWFGKNLNVGTKLASGATLPSNNSLIEKWCYGNSDANCTAEGGLYTWAETLQLDPSCNSSSAGACTPTPPTQGICPSGWHIPTDAEIKTMEVALGMCTGGTSDCVDYSGGYRGVAATVGTKLKSGGSSGFNLLLAGYRNTGGSFSSRGSFGNLWSASPDSATGAWYRLVLSGNAGVGRFTLAKASGFSVRCLKN